MMNLIIVGFEKVSNSSKTCRILVEGNSEGVTTEQVASHPMVILHALKEGFKKSFRVEFTSSGTFFLIDPV